MQKKDLQERLDWFLKQLPNYIQHNYMSKEAKEKIDKIENIVEKLDNKINDISKEQQDVNLKFIKNDFEIKAQVDNLSKIIEDFIQGSEHKFITKSQYDLDQIKIKNDQVSIAKFLEKINKKFDTLEVISFLSKHRKVALLCVVGFFVVFLWGIKDFIIETITFIINS